MGEKKDSLLKGSMEILQKVVMKEENSLFLQWSFVQMFADNLWRERTDVQWVEHFVKKNEMLSMAIEC